MDKYNVTVEVCTVSKELITVDASSHEEAHQKIREIFLSPERCYSYLSIGIDDSFRITDVKKEED